MNSLSEFWRRFTPVEGSNIHPDDRRFFEEKPPKQKKTMNFSSSTVRSDEDRFTVRLGLLPQPYMGDIENSKIIIVMLNPGYEGGEYDEHIKDETSRQAILDTIHQNFSGVLSEYRYMYLNPRFRLTDGYKYLYATPNDPRIGRLRECIEFFAQKHHISPEESVRFIANNICMVEVFPYHSNKFKGQYYNQIKGMPSLEAMNDFLEEKVSDLSNRVFITRGVDALRRDYTKCSNVSIFGPGEYLHGYFKIGKHGDTLINRLDELWQDRK